MSNTINIVFTRYDVWVNDKERKYKRDQTGLTTGAQVTYIQEQLKPMIKNDLPTVSR